MSGTIDNRVAVNTEYCPQSINGYEIIKLLEECGSQSSVYLAQKHDENFIVKIYNFSLTDEIEDVLSSIKSLRHKSIAEIVEYGEKEGHAYEIQKYYDRDRYSLNPRYFVSHCLRGINHVLSELHMMNIVHLDVKPDNIYFSDSTVKLLDFGICSRVGKKAAGYSPDYSAPEVAEKGKFSPESDYYSLGITLFELVMGYNPFRNVDIAKKQQLKENPMSWLPYNYMDFDFYELIYNLVSPAPYERWGFSEVNNWIDNHDNSDYASKLKKMMDDSGQMRNQTDNNIHLGDYVNEAIYKGDEGIDSLFSDDSYDMIKFQDSILSFLINKYKSTYFSNKTEAAIKVKTEYNKDKFIAVPGKIWKNYKELGVELINYAIGLYDICVKSDIERIDKNNPRIILNQSEPQLWSMLKNGYLESYLPDEKRELFSGAVESIVQYINNIQATQGNVFINSTDFNQNKPEYCIRKEFYCIIYQTALLGYTVSGVRSFTFNSLECKSLDEIYDTLLEVLNGDENMIHFYGRYISNSIYADDGSSKVALQPVLQALVDVTNGKWGEIGI